jgi:hypothetical protein
MHFPLPLFDQGLESGTGIRENALDLRERFLDHNGLLIAQLRTTDYWNTEQQAAVVGNEDTLTSHR